MATKHVNDTVEKDPSQEVDIESPAKVDLNSRNVDDAFRFAVAGEDVTWTAEEERKVLWKIDAVILPLLFIGAIVGYADAQAYGFAALFGLVIDLKLYSFNSSGLDLSRYSLTAGMAQLGAAAGQYPLLALAQFFSYGKVNAVVIMYTGALAILTVVCKNFSDIMALRFFFGFSVITQPLAIIITSMWWKTNEQPLRVGIFIAGAALGQLIGQAIDIGAVGLEGVYAGHSWKWIYVILGSVVLGWGLVVFVAFPATPMKAWFLNHKEKVIAVRRLIQNNTGIQTRNFKLQQVREAFLDPQLALLGVYAFSFAFVNNAIGSFGGFIVSSFGYSGQRLLVMTMPASAVAALSMITSGLLGSRFPQRRILIAMIYILPSLAGNALLWKLDRSNVAGLLAGLYISTTFYGALVQEFALLASNVGGHTKKSVMNASIVLLSNLGGFAGPWAYHGNEAAQGYPTGQTSALSLLCASEGALALLWLYYHLQNKKKAAMREAQPELVNDPNNSLVDMTDQENAVFCYCT